MVDSFGTFDNTIWSQLKPEYRDQLRYTGFFTVDQTTGAREPYFYPFRALPTRDKSSNITDSNSPDYTPIHRSIIERYEQRKRDGYSELNGEDVINAFNKQQLDRYRGLSRSEIRQLKIQWVTNQGATNFRNSEVRDMSWGNLYREYRSQELDIPIWRGMDNLFNNNNPQQAINHYQNMVNNNQINMFFDLETFGAFNQRTGQIDEYFMPYQATFMRGRYVDGHFVEDGPARSFIINPRQSKQFQNIQELLEKLRRSKDNNIIESFSDAEYRTIKDLVKIGSADVKNGEIKNISKVLSDDDIVDLRQYYDEALSGLEKISGKDALTPSEFVAHYNRITQEITEEGGVMAGHNVLSYDIPAMEVFAKKEGLEVNKVRDAFDTLDLFRSLATDPEDDLFYGLNTSESGYLTLDALRHRLGMDRGVTDAHTSGYDVRSMVEILDRYQGWIERQTGRLTDPNHPGFFADMTNIQKGDILFAPYGQQRYGKAAADAILDIGEEGLEVQQFPRNSVTRKSYYQVIDAFEETVEDETKYNMILKNLSTEQDHLITRNSRGDLQSYIQKMFQYQADLDETEMSMVKAHYEMDLARGRYRNMFRGDRAFYTAEKFYGALDVDEADLAEYFDSPQQLRDFMRLRDRLESEKAIVQPALEYIGKHYGADYKANKAMIQLGRILDESFGEHKEEIKLLDFERRKIDIPTMDNRLTNVVIPDYERGTQNLWWTIYNQTKGRDPRAREVYFQDILQRLERQEILTHEARQKISKKEGVRYQIQALINDLMQNDNLIKANEKMEVDSLQARASMQLGDDAATKGRNLAAQAVGIVEKSDWNNNYVHDKLDFLSQRATDKLPNAQLNPTQRLEYNLRKNIDEITKSLTWETDAGGQAGVVFSMTDDNRLLMAVTHPDQVAGVEQSLFKGSPSTKAAYVDIPIPDEYGLIHHKNTTKAAQGYIKHTLWNNKAKDAYELRTVTDEIASEIKKRSRTIKEAVNVGDIRETQRQINHALNSVLMDLPDTSRGMTSQGRYATISDVVKEQYIQAEGLAPQIAGDLGLTKKRQYQDILSQKDYLELNDLHLADKQKVLYEMPKYIEDIFGLKVNTASIKATHVADAKFSVMDVREFRPFAWYSQATRPNFIQMQRHYQLSDTAIDKINESSNVSLSQGIMTEELLDIESKYGLNPSSVSMNVAMMDNFTIENLYKEHGIDVNNIVRGSTYENTAAIRQSNMKLFDAEYMKSITFPEVPVDEIEFSGDVLRAFETNEEVTLKYKDLIAKYKTQSGKWEELRYLERNAGIIQNVDLRPGRQSMQVRTKAPAMTSMKLDIEGEKVTVIPMADEIMDQIAGEDISMIYSSNIAKHEDFGAPIAGQLNKIVNHIESLPDQERRDAKHKFITEFNKIFDQNLDESNVDKYFRDYQGSMAFVISGKREAWQQNVDANEISKLLNEFGISETRTVGGEEFVTQRLSVGRQIVDEHLNIQPTRGGIPSWAKQDVGVKFAPRQTMAIRNLWGFDNVADYIEGVAREQNAFGPQIEDSMKAINYMLEGTPENADIRTAGSFNKALRGSKGYLEETLQGTVVKPDNIDSNKGVFLSLPETIRIDRGDGAEVALNEIYLAQREFGGTPHGGIELDKIQSTQARIHDLAIEYNQRMVRPPGVSLDEMRSTGKIKEDLKRNVEKYYYQLTDSISGKEGDIAKQATVRLPGSGHGRVKIISPTAPSAENIFTQKDWDYILNRDINDQQSWGRYQETLNKHAKRLGIDSGDIIEEGTVYISADRAKEIATNMLDESDFNQELYDRLLKGDGVFGLGLRYPIFYKEAVQPVRIKAHKDIHGHDMWMTKGTAHIVHADTDGDISGFVLPWQEKRKQGEWIRTQSSIDAENELKNYFKSQTGITQRKGYAEDAMIGYLDKRTGTSGKIVTELNEQLKREAAQSPGKIQTLKNLAGDGGRFTPFVDADDAINRAKLGKMGIGYLSNINMKIKQMALGVQNQDQQIFKRLFTDLDVDDPFESISRFGQTLEQEFIDVKHADLIANFGKDAAPHLSVDVGRTINRGNFDAIRNIRKVSDNNPIFDPTDVDVVERFHRAMNDIGAWNAPETKLFLSSQLADYGGGAAGLARMMDNAGKGASIMTPYLENVLGETGVQKSMTGGVIDKLSSWAPDSISNAAAGMSGQGATKRIIGSHIEDAAASAVNMTGKTLKTAGIIGAVMGAAYAVSHFFRKDPLEPEKIPQADQAPDVTGAYNEGSYSTPERIPADMEGAPRQAPPRANTGEQKAYVQENKGYNINVRARGNMNKERMGSLIQDGVQGGSSVPVNVNMNINDNTQEIDNRWLEEKFARALEDGYAY